MSLGRSHDADRQQCGKWRPGLSAGGKGYRPGRRRGTGTAWDHYRWRGNPALHSRGELGNSCYYVNELIGQQVNALPGSQIDH